MRLLRLLAVMLVLLAGALLAGCTDPGGEKKSLAKNVPLTDDMYVVKVDGMH